MPVELLIDGYNLLHNAGLARSKYKPGEFERARDKLLKRLRDSLNETERTHTTIIFDAQYAEHSDRRPLHLYGMTVLFSPRGRQADDLIEILLSGHPNPQQIMVISSDHRLQRAARIARAESLSCDSFLVDLDERKLKQPDDQSEQMIERSDPGRESPGTEAADMDRWLKEFGEIDVDSITRDVVREDSAKKRDLAAELSQEKADVPSPKSVSSTPIIPQSPQHAVESGSPGIEFDEPTQAPPAELSFWEQRIQEMLREEEFDPKKSRRK